MMHTFRYAEDITEDHLALQTHREAVLMLFQYWQIKGDPKVQTEYFKEMDEQVVAC